MINKQINVKQVLMSEYSRTFIDVQVELVQQRPELLESYWEQYTLLHEPYSRRAAWVISHVVDRNPEVIKASHLKELLALAPDFTTDAGKRCMTRILSLVKIPEDLQGHVVDRCFKWLNSTDESIAVRNYCIDTLFRLSEEIPEIGIELQAMLEHHMERFSTGLKNKGTKVLRKLRSRRF
jgi:hypothetical protein